jgi:DNA-binding transcriptional regulator LsrR (DeoR family)
MPKIFRTRKNCEQVRRMRFEDRLPRTEIAKHFGVDEKTIDEALRKGPIKVPEIRRRKAS